MGKILSKKILLFTLIIFILTTGCAEKPKKNISFKEIEKAISMSEDYNKHKKAFLSKTKKLVDKGRCTLQEIKKMGGWWYAPEWSKKMGGRPCYLIYCGGMTLDNKIYIDPLGFDKVE